MKDSKSEIILVVKNLIETREIIFSQIINLAMNGEMKEIDNVFEIGETYNFTLKHFDNTKDINVKKLVNLCKKTEQTIFTIMDLNGINENEIETT